MNEMTDGSEAVTRGVQVSVRPSFVPEQSNAMAGRWFFSYRIRISNLGEQTVQLISRHWIITDANGAVEEVRGQGVVGEQPVLKQGESFEYTSFCPLETPFGTMEGSYQMVSKSGGVFDAEIARFNLCEPLVAN